jgi:hypothetical protein
MPIQLEDERKPGLPVVKRTVIGQAFYGAIVLVQQRDRLKRDEVTNQMAAIMKADGKAKQELVVTCITLPNTTAPVGLGEDEHPAEEGELVRLILKGKAFGDWIETKTSLGRPVQVGDIVTQVTDRAQAYDAHGNPSGAEITDQAAVNALPRGRSVGIYGPVTLRAPKDGSEWIAKAEEAYHSLKNPIAAEENYQSPPDDGGYPAPEEPAYDESEPPF